MASLPPDVRPHLQVAILIDDIGQDMAALHGLLEIDAPLSFAVLPYQTHSREAAELLYSRGRDFLLHLPMEPHDYPAVNPGEGALLSEMSDPEIRILFRKALHDIPHARGVNNHMGSRFTADEDKLTVVMKELRQQGLYFVDSRTTADSKAGELATRMGVPFRSRNIFIDNEQTYEASRNTLNRVLSTPVGTTGDTLLMIGHPYPSTITALRDTLPQLRAKGVRIVPVSKIVGR